MYFDIIFIYPATCREWQHDQPASATDDTDDKCDTGGAGKYSHGSICLSHQHWVDQVIAAGSFGVHCTEAAESYHKICMKLAAWRVRHLRVNTTQASMLKYLCNYELFEELRTQLPFMQRKRREMDTDYATHIKIPLHDFAPGEVMAPVTMGINLDRVELQQKFLHREARIARAELMDLVCEKFCFPKTRPFYRLLGQMKWKFGQKLITTSGCVYWATNSQYNAFNDKNRRTRRDIVRVAGTEPSSLIITSPDGTRQHTRNSLRVECICFVSIRGILDIMARNNLRVPRDVSVAMISNKWHDEIIFILGRWFTPHPATGVRDSEYNPICPDPLNLNHCLWRYARTDQYRKIMCNRDGTQNNNCTSQLHIFGRNACQQQRCFEQERKAYFCLLTPANIVRKVHMTPEYKENSLESGDTWLETLTIV